MPKRMKRSGKLRRGDMVRVFDTNSMYRGHVGTIVEPNSRKLSRLGIFERALVHEGYLLVEEPSGKLFVTSSHSIECV